MASHTVAGMPTEAECMAHARIKARAVMEHHLRRPLNKMACDKGFHVMGLIAERLHAKVTESADRHLRDLLEGWQLDEYDEEICVEVNDKDRDALLEKEKPIGETIIVELEKTFDTAFDHYHSSAGKLVVDKAVDRLRQDLTTAYKKAKRSIKEAWCPWVKKYGFYRVQAGKEQTWRDHVDWEERNHPNVEVASTHLKKWGPPEQWVIDVDYYCAGYGYCTGFDD